MAMLKTRFCPSPTGYIHVGNVRTALFSALYALQVDGHMLLRIEDTDKTRSYTEYTNALITDLHWLGIPWQEGAGCEPQGEHQPYWQSQRQAIYDGYYTQLLDAKMAFPCFCSEEQLALTRKVQRASGQPPRYAGTCRDLTEQDIAEKRQQGLAETVRFRVPDDQAIEFVDLVKGKQRFLSNDIGDFIIRRADGSAPFMYSNALDDALMGVTHVLRGDDHLTNTPRQLMLLSALGLTAPSYGHVSLILGDDKLPLSKRNGSRSIDQLRQEGYLPLAIINYIARLGHYYADNQLMTLTELANAFDIQHLSTSPARFEASQLQFWQKEVVMMLEQQTLWQWLPESVTTQVPETDQTAFIDAIRPNVLFPHDATVWADCVYGDELTLTPDSAAILANTHGDFFTTAIAIVEQHGLDYSALTQQLKTQCNVKGKGLFQPLRVVLTGQLHGPELAQLLPLMGKQRVIARFQQATQHSKQ